MMAGNLFNGLHFDGIFIGICTFIIIGVFHPIVVKAEYYWSKNCWWIFLIAGILCLIASLWVDNRFISPLLGVLGFTCLWSIREMYEQEERVRKGWYPKNPKRKYPFS